MSKDPRITALILQLRKMLRAGSFVVVDHWPEDPTAIGISSADNAGVLAYVSLYGLTKPFTVILEVPPRTGSDLPYEDIGQFECDSLEDAASIVRDHLANGS